MLGEPGQIGEGELGMYMIMTHGVYMYENFKEWTFVPSYLPLLPVS